MTAADLGQTEREGLELLARLDRAHHEAWGVDDAQAWGFDHQTGTLTWSFPDRTATAPAQLLGAYDHAVGSWRWAWAGMGIDPESTWDARFVREWGNRHGFTPFTEPELFVDGATVVSLAAVAVRVVGAGGLYQGIGGDVVPLLTFSEVTVTHADGAVRTYRVEIDEPVA